jgi:hypothetical protein
MKTSTLIATLAVTCGIVTITATNLKLKDEYSKGKLQDPYIKKELASFHFIKDMTDTSSLRGGHFEIHVGKSEGSSVSNYYSITPTFLFEVANDTLYISTDKTSDSRYVNWSPLIIRTNHLTKIDLNNGDIDLAVADNPDLTITAGKKSNVDVKIFGKMNTLSVFAGNSAAVAISAEDTINKMTVQLNDRSSFNAKDLLIVERSMQLSSRANLQLSGRSIENFGLKNSQ